MDSISGDKFSALAHPKSQEISLCLIYKGISNIKLIDARFMQNLQEMWKKKIMQATRKKEELPKLENKNFDNLYLEI